MLISYKLLGNEALLPIKLFLQQWLHCQAISSVRILFSVCFLHKQLVTTATEQQLALGETKLRWKKSPSLRTSAKLSFKIRSKQETKEVHKVVWAFFPQRSFRWQVKALVQRVNKFSRLNAKKNMHVNAHISLRKMYPQLQVIFTG